MSNMSIREFLDNFEKNNWEDPSVLVQIEAGWYDWFCKESSLQGKTRKLANKLKTLIGSPFIDLDKHYVFFKNNCPLYGPLYDDFRICSLETRNVIFTITPRVIPSRVAIEGKCNVYVASLGKSIGFNSWREVKKYFGV